MKQKKAIPMFRTHMRFLVALAIAVVLVVLLGTYSYLKIRNSTDVEAVDSLSGQRIACCVAWEADYLLTPREDITLLRYDTNSDCLLALSFGQVDAMAMDDMVIASTMGKTTGLEVIPGVLTTVGCTLVASNYAGEILDQFNEFVADFVASDDYPDFRARTITSEDFVMADIPEVKDGKKLNVGYCLDCYPECYIDFVTGLPKGYGIEIVKRFAYEYGYTVEWSEESESSVYINVANGKNDLSLAFITDIYREEMEETGYVKMTEPYLYTDIYLVKVKDGEKLTITGEISD